MTWRTSIVDLFASSGDEGTLEERARMVHSKWPHFAFLLAAVLFSVLLFNAWRPDLLLVGNVTIDVLGTGTKATFAPGGTAIRSFEPCKVSIARTICAF
jgi:hypothetical protein